MSCFIKIHIAEEESGPELFLDGEVVAPADSECECEDN